MQRLEGGGKPVVQGETGSRCGWWRRGRESLGQRLNHLGLRRFLENLGCQLDAFSRVTLAPVLRTTRRAEVEAESTLTIA